MSASPGEARCTKGYPSGSPQQSAAQQQPGQHQLLHLPRSVTTAAQPQSWKPLQPLQRQATNKVTMWVSPCRPRQRHLGALSCGACCGRSGVPLRRIVRAHKACAAARAAAASHEAPHSHQCRSQVRQKSDMLNALGSWAAPRNRRPLDPARTRATSESTGCLALSIMSAGKKPPWVSRRRMHHAAGAGARPQAGWGGGRCAGKNLKKKEVFFSRGLVRRGPRGSLDDSRRLAERPLRRRPPLRLRLRLRRRLLCQGNRAAPLSEPRIGHGGAAAQCEPGVGTAPWGVSSSCSTGRTPSHALRVHSQGPAGQVPCNAATSGWGGSSGQF